MVRSTQGVLGSSSSDVPRPNAIDGPPALGILSNYENRFLNRESNETISLVMAAKRR
jgi:hypothetical protein